MNVLIIGNNPKHAKLFSMFCENVYLLLQDTSSIHVNRITKELYDYNLLYSNLEYGTLNFHINRCKEIRKIIFNNNVEIIFCNTKDDMIQAKIAVLGMKKRPLLLVTFHNSLAWINDRKVFLMAKMIDNCTNGCVCLASFMYEKLLKYGIAKEKLLFLPNTIQFENFTVKNDYHLQRDNKVRLCYTAVLYPLKNQKIIIEAVNALKDRYNFEVHLYGDYVDQNYYLELKRLIEKYNLSEIVFLDGGVDNSKVRELLPQNDIYISSTTIEMSPYNILEAKASGLPVLASHVLGQSDLIEDMVDGVLYDINDLNDLTGKLCMLIDDVHLRQKFGQNARRSISEVKTYVKASENLEDFVKLLG